MPTETLIAVKVPAEVAAHIDRVSSDRQRFVMLAIMDALARQATASETEVDKDNDRAKLDRESREWLEEDMENISRRYLTMIGATSSSQIQEFLSNRLQELDWSEGREAK